MESIHPHHLLFPGQNEICFFQSKFLQEGSRAGYTPMHTWLVPTKPSASLNPARVISPDTSLAVKLTESLRKFQVSPDSFSQTK